MGKIVASVRNQRAPGAAATTLTDDIKFGFNAHSLHLDTFGLLVASAADTFQGVVDEVTQVRVETTVSTPESTIDGDDLFDFLPNLKAPPFITNNVVTADNTPKAFSLQYPFTPFPLDDTRNYGLPAGRGVQFVVDWQADTTIDNRTYDLTVEGLSNDSQPSSNGYIVFQRDAYTSGAVGEENFTKVTGNRLLGSMNFMTTEYDALAASAAPNVIGIREQAVLQSSNIILGPYKPYRNHSFNPYVKAVRAGASPEGTVLNLGHDFADYGIHNTGRIGLDIAGKNIEIRTTAGVAEATRVNAVVLRS